MKNRSEICLIIALGLGVVAAILNLFIIYFDANIIENQTQMLDQQINITHKLGVLHEAAMALIEAHLNYVEAKNKDNEDALNNAKDTYNSSTNISEIKSAKNDSIGHRSVIEENKSWKKYIFYICVLLNIIGLIIISMAFWEEYKKEDMFETLLKLIKNEDNLLATIEIECNESKSSIREVLEKIENYDNKLNEIAAKHKKFENSIKMINFHRSGKIACQSLHRSGKIAFLFPNRKGRRGKGRA